MHYFDHHNQEEAERIAQIQHDQFTVERTVRDVVRAGEWNEHFKQKHPEYKEIWEDEERRKAEIREKLFARSRQRWARRRQGHVFNFYSKRIL